MCGLIGSVPQGPGQQTGKFSFQATSFYVDPLNYIYGVNHNELTKYDLHGKKLTTFAHGAISEITSADVSDPLKCMLFDKPFQALITLDNRLVPLVSPLTFGQLGFSSVECVCVSGLGGYWLFDKMESRLFYLDVNFSVSVRSESLASLVKNHGREHWGLQEQGRRVFLISENGPVLEFDLLGNFIHEHDISSHKDLQVNGKYFYYSISNLIIRYNIENDAYDTLSVTLPGEDVLFRVNKNYVFVKEQNTMQVFKIR